jgi:hypothetical protein
MEWGVGPGAACHIDSLARQGRPRGHASGAGPFSGEGHTIRDPELVERAQRAAARLESAWEQSRAPHGLAVAPGQPVVSYAGYSLKEPSGEPRVVIGIDADEAEYLAEFLDRDECVQRVQIPQQQGRRAELPPEAPVSTPVLRCSARRSATAATRRIRSETWPPS